MPCGCIYNDRKNWGSLLWSVLHYLPIKLSSLQNIPKLREFIKNFYIALPCDECHKHCKEYMSNNEIILTNDKDLSICKRDISKFIYDFHNFVNKFTNKPQYISFEEYQKRTVPYPNFNEIRKIFENTNNRNFYLTHLDNIQKQYNNSFINTFMTL